MKVYSEYQATDFPFWSGAESTVQKMPLKDLERIWEYLEEYYDMIDDVPSETEINDYFWFETDDIAQILGYEDYETYLEHLKEGDINEECRDYFA